MTAAGRRFVSLVTLWQVAASVCYYAVFAATPFFRSEFGLSRFHVGFVLTALTVGYAVFLLPVGAVIDRFGERWVLLVGLGGIAAATLLVAGSPSVPALFAAVFVLGSLYATAIPGTNKAIYDNVPAGRRNVAMGVKQVGVTAGSGISALLVTGLATVYAWQAGFAVAAAIAALVAVGFGLWYPAASGGGTATYPDFGALLDNWSYLALVAAGFFLGAALFTTTGYTVLFVDEGTGASVAFGGLVLALVQAFGSVGRVVSGWLADALPGDARVRIGALLAVQALASAGLFAAAGTVGTPLAAAVVFSALGFFALGNTGVYYSCLATLIPADEMGGATAGAQLSVVLGSVVAPPAFGYLADVASYRLAWWLLAAGSLAAAALVAVVVRLEPAVEEAAIAK